MPCTHLPSEDTEKDILVVVHLDNLWQKSVWQYFGSYKPVKLWEQHISSHIESHIWSSSVVSDGRYKTKIMRSDKPFWNSIISIINFYVESFKQLNYMNTTGLIMNSNTQACHLFLVIGPINIVEMFTENTMLIIIVNYTKIWHIWYVSMTPKDTVTVRTIWPIEEYCVKESSGFEFEGREESCMF